MARVIRGGGHVVPGEVVDAHAEAEKILAEAKAQAAAVLSKARAEAEAVEAESARLGREEAESEAAALLVSAAALRDRALAEAEGTVKELAIAAAKHIVTAELSLSPERIADIVRDVLGRARRARRVEVRVHPDDAAHLGEAFSGAQVVEDAGIERGGCIVRTELGQLDARLEVRLDALARRLSG